MVKGWVTEWGRNPNPRLLSEAGILADEILEMRERAAEICKEYRHGRAAEEVYSDEEMEEMGRQMEQIGNNVQESVQPEENGILNVIKFIMVSFAYYMCNMASSRD